MEFFIFILFSLAILVSGFATISVRNPVNCVFFLVLAFCNASGLFLLLEVEFLAILFLIVYVGAIAVLFLFVIIILDLKSDFVQNYYIQFKQNDFLFVCLSIVFFLFFEFYLILTENIQSNLAININSWSSWVLSFDFFSNLNLFGQILYTYYFFYFLFVGFVLLVAIIGAVCLCLQKNSVSFFLSKNRQKIWQQISRSADKSIFLVKNKC